MDFLFMGLAPLSLLVAAAIPGTVATAQPQQTATKSDSATFGSAADGGNIVFTPAQAGGPVDRPEDINFVISIGRYTVVKWGTYLLDYAYLIGMFYVFDLWFGGENWGPSAAAKIIMMNSTGITLLDILKAVLFSDVVAKAKLDHLQALWQELCGLLNEDGLEKVVSFLTRVASGEGIIHEFKDKSAHRRGVLYHIFYFVKIALVMVPLSSAFQAHIGMFHFRPLMETVATVGVGQWWEFKISCLAVVYFEYIAMSFVKDALSMNVLHQMMHRQWYHMHKVHHMPMKELSVVNLWFFDLPDLVIENIVAPVILVGLKVGLSPEAAGPVSLHWLSFIMLAITDVNIHSISPYSIGFFNPILDSILKSNISHSLHHALNIGHYTVWPWHQLKGVAAYDPHTKTNNDGSIATDMAAYNRVFNTSFPEE